MFEQLQKMNAQRTKDSSLWDADRYLVEKNN